MRKTHKYCDNHKVVKMADGGKVYGAPMGPTPAPGGTTRKRPKVGDKDPNWPPPKKGGKPKRIETPGKPGDSGPGGKNPGKNREPTYNHRDYRGTRGAIDDAEGIPKK